MKPTRVQLFHRIFSIVVLFVLISCPVSAEVGFGDTLYTYIQSQGIGNIAVRIECPETSRYPQGAPIVVEVGTWFVHYNNFHRVNDTKRIGAVTVSYLWPGRLDAVTGMQSDGDYDYGGPVSLAALKDVIRYASGLIPDESGDYITDLSMVPVLLDNVGLFASSHSGVVATNVLAYFGEDIPSVKYLVGRENPTRDEMYPLELGYFDGNPSEQNKVYNRFFHEESYSTDTVEVDYSTVGWVQPQGEPTGRPYFAAKDTFPEHIMAHDKTPVMNGKRVYSRALTHALLDNGALTLENWPDDLTTPAETDSIWPYRITVYNYPLIGMKLPNLKIMLVFARYDHVQASRTKPHIHQAWDGFRYTAGLWVRMNPDRAYASSVNLNYGPTFPDNLAIIDPVDWIYIEDYGFPADHGVREDMWLASVAEMADRVYSDDWSADLDSALFPVLIDSDETGVGRFPSPGSAPTDYRILHNFPNPFNSSTTIRIQLAKPSHIRMTICDLRGRELEVLIDGIHLTGEHDILWDAVDYPSGTYLCKLTIGEYAETRKLIFQR